jgi:hypothetical protein
VREREGGAVGARGGRESAEEAERRVGGSSSEMGSKEGITSGDGGWGVGAVASVDSAAARSPARAICVGVMWMVQRRRRALSSAAVVRGGSPLPVEKRASVSRQRGPSVGESGGGATAAAVSLDGSARVRLAVARWSRAYPMIPQTI